MKGIFIYLIVMLISVFTILDYEYTKIHEDLHESIANDFDFEVVDKEVHYWFTNKDSFVATKVNTTDMTIYNNYINQQSIVDIVGYQVHIVLIMLMCFTLIILISLYSFSMIKERDIIADYEYKKFTHFYTSLK